MSKIVVMKIHVEAAAAKPTAGLSAKFAPFGVRPPELCKIINEKTQNFPPKVLVSVAVSINKEARTFEVKETKIVVSSYIKMLLAIGKGSTTPGLKNIAKITKSQVIKVVETCLKYNPNSFNSFGLEESISIVKGTVRSMGIDFIDD